MFWRRSNVPRACSPCSQVFSTLRLPQFRMPSWKSSNLQLQPIPQPKQHQQPPLPPQQPRHHQGPAHLHPRARRELKRAAAAQAAHPAPKNADNEASALLHQQVPPAPLESYLGSQSQKWTTFYHFPVKNPCKNLKSYNNPFWAKR